MGNTCKKTTVVVDNAKLESVFGRCGFGSCRSSCCEEQEVTQESGLAFPQDKLKWMGVATRVELARVHKIVTEAMMSASELPRLDVVQEDTEDAGITIVVRVGTGKAIKGDGQK